MKHNYEKSKFLEILRENPWVSFAAKKSGISRATIYRWMKDAPEFRREVELAMKAGNSQLDEIAEMGLTKKIKEGHFQAIKYYLSHNNPRYIVKANPYVSPPLVHNHSSDIDSCEICRRVSIEKEVRLHEVNTQIRKEIERLANPKTEKDKEDKKKLMAWLGKGKSNPKPKGPPLRARDLT